MFIKPTQRSDNTVSMPGFNFIRQDDKEILI